MNKNVALLLCIAFIVLLGYNGYIAMQKINGSTERQKEAIEELQRWKEAYRSLEPIEEQWQETFNEIEKVQDMATLKEQVGLTGSHLDIEADKLRVTDTEQTSLQGEDLALAKVSIADEQTSDGITIRVDDIEQVLEVIKDLDERIDVNMGSVVLEREGGVINLQINSLDFYLRGEA